MPGRNVISGYSEHHGKTRGSSEHQTEIDATAATGEEGSHALPLPQAQTKWGLRRMVSAMVSSDCSSDTERSLYWLLTFGLLVFVSGSLSLIVVAWISHMKGRTCPTCQTKPFDYPHLMQFFQAFGMALCYPVYWIDRYFHRWRHNRPFGRLQLDQLGDPSLPVCPWYYWLLPGTIDAIQTTLSFYAIRWLNNTTVQIMRCSTLLVTAILTMVWFKRDIRITAWCGLLLLMIGNVPADIAEWHIFADLECISRPSLRILSLPHR